MKKKFSIKWSDGIGLLLIVVLLIPQTRKPIAVFFNKLIAFSPSEIEKRDQKKIVDYTWLLQTPSKGTINFNQFKNKVIVINFWATWCPPCIAEMSSYQQVFNSYKKDVIFLFVSNEDLKTTAQFMENNGYTLPIYKPISQLNTLSYSQLPTSYVIDKNGNIVIRKVGAADWNSDNFHQILNDLIGN